MSALVIAGLALIALIALLHTLVRRHLNDEEER